MIDAKKYSLWTALVTPMHENGSIDFDSLDRLVRKQEEAQNGLLIVGSTGEGLALSLHEKLQIMQFVKSLNPTVPIMAGVGGFQLEEQLEWMAICEEIGVDSYLLVTPCYAKPGIQGQINWFKSLLDATDKPCMLYNIPGRAAVKLFPQVLVELKNHPNLWALKESSGSVSDYENYLETIPSVSIFSGDDSMMPYFSVSKIDGLVSVASNVWPTETKLYMEQCIALNNTKELLQSWKYAIASLFQASNPVPVKTLLYKKGWISSPYLRPPLSHLDVCSIDNLLKADKEILKWFENIKKG